MLYLRGDPAVLSSPQLLAVVGSRRPNSYGRQCVSKILTPVVQVSLPLVSGLAYGIDSMAHRLCLEFGTPTIAVLGSGLDDGSIYPKIHAGLLHQIIDAGGSIISEYPAGTPPHLGQFPVRNRIIAGLCQATFVVQAAQRSGSLITARLALESGREVLAVPGAITDSLAAGVNFLIQQGATPVISAEDILNLYGLSSPDIAEINQAKLTRDQKTVAAALGSQPLHIDELVEQTKLPSTVLAVALTELELMEIALNTGGMRYIKK